mgnify:CR=1 FL=1
MLRTRGSGTKEHPPVERSSGVARFAASMLKVGAIGFGGGSALIPILHAELVETGDVVPAGKLSEAEFTHDTVIANITPGALPVKMAAQAGTRLWGARGALIGAFAVTLPGAAATTALLWLFSGLDEHAVRLIEFASIGVSAFILFLLAHYIFTVLAPGGRLTLSSLAIAVVSFLLTGTKGTVELVFGLFGADAAKDIPALSALGLVVGALVAISLFTLFQGLKGGDALRIPEDQEAAAGSRTALRAALLFALVAVSGFAIALLTVPSADTATFFGLQAASTVSSFGGGEAYVGVADSFFVTPGIESSSVFYGQIVPVANALPGPILVKIAAALGFSVGASSSGPLAGLAFALASMLVTVGSCASVALLLLAGYSRAGKSLLVRNISRFILPVICGLLLSTCISLLAAAVEITSVTAVPAPAVLSVILVLAVLSWWAKSRLRVPDLAIIAALAAMTVVGLAWGQGA